MESAGNADGQLSWGFARAPPSEGPRIDLRTDQLGIWRAKKKEKRDKSHPRRDSPHTPHKGHDGIRARCRISARSRRGPVHDSSLTLVLLDCDHLGNGGLQHADVPG